ncbi:interleukin-20 receptor subunit alpha [Dicentrarchus labrax]|uniref:Interleukin-20 receptor subunit alpha n=1 Tax=Dicentrarchus labrax TaxID=13489 RepID=A0A8P4GCI4_DICLA|nr:interleukin-20 receptor subunit alpha [Dicentrarchus labrax]
MWTELLFLYLGALHCSVSSSPPSPVNVFFSSLNLRNVLQWLPGNGTLNDTHFTVQYAIYGDSVEGTKRVRWREVQRCTDIVRRWCDLSNETGDLKHSYHARVRAVSRRASSKWAFTRKRFDPHSDTTFGPPLVSVELEDNSAIISLRGPMIYQPNNDTPKVSMATLYSQMTYNLSIRDTRRIQTSYIPIGSVPYKYRLMEYDTEYCFSALARFISIPLHCQSSAWHCITTPPDPVIGQLRRVVVGIVVPLVCMCMLLVVGYVLYYYLTGKEEKSPYILNPPSFHQPPLMSPPENLNITLITIIQSSDLESGVSDRNCPKRDGPFAEPPPAYAPQRAQREVPPEPEDPWDDESVDYGFVGVAPKISVRGEEEEREERRHDGGEDGNNLKGVHLKGAAEDSHKKKDWRVGDGHRTGVHALRAKSYLSQKSTHTCSQTHMPTEMSTLIQAHAFSQVNSVPPTHTQTPLLSLQGTTKGEEDGEKQGRECPGLFINKTPQIGLFHVPLNLQTKKEEEMDGKLRARRDEKIGGGVEEESESEGAPLLSAYASQSIKGMSTSHADQADVLPDDYGVLRLATVVRTEDEEEEEEEEEGTLCIDWDPETRQLVLPEMGIEFSGEEGLMQDEKGRENRMGGEEEEEEVNATKGELKLENVYVRQGSEEVAEAQKEMERSGERGWEVDDILTKWNLVISMDQ